MCAFLYGINKGHMRLENFHCWNLWANHSKVKLSGKIFSAESAVLESSQGTFLSFHFIQHSIAGSTGCKCWSGEEGNPPLYVLLMTLHPERPLVWVVSHPCGLPGRAALHPRRKSEHGGSWSVWFPSYVMIVRTLPTLRDVLLLSARI